MDVKFSENLFISVEELNRLKSSIGENGWKRFAKNLISKFGIAVNENNTNFIPINISTPETPDLFSIQKGIAFDADMNAIVLDESVNVSLPSDTILGSGYKYWLVLRHAITHNEVGTVSVNETGALTGIGTKFTEVLRGQPDFPTKVKLDSAVNTGEYEVVEVSSDTSAILAGSFTNESNKKYSVVGTFTPGFIPNEDNRQIYSYDSCEIEVIMSATQPEIRDGYEFILASVEYIANMDNSYDTILNDYRVDYLLNFSFDDEEVVENKELTNDAIVSLVRESVVGLDEKGILVELLMEHGFSVTDFTVEATASGYKFTINSGSSNYINTNSDLPDHMFRGWCILNRANMQYCEITDSINKVLSITKINSLAVTGTTDIVLIPPFNEIEYSVLVSNNVSEPTKPYIVRCSLENIQNRLLIPIYWNDVSGYDDSVTLTLKYRIIGFSRDKYPFYKFNTANYIDHDGNIKSCAGTISINVTNLKPEAEQRNYS